MTISFNAIPLNLRTPGAYLEFDARKATGGVAQLANRVLLIGQRLATGASPALAPVRLFSADQAVQAFGRGSMLAGMARAFKAADSFSECWAIALDDLVAGTAATGTITVTGPATAAGTVPLLIAGARVAVGVAAAASANTVAAAIAAAVNAQPDLPVTAAAAAAVVTLTARHKGTAGNDIDVRHSFYDGEALPAGIALVIVAMANGAGNPDHAALWPVIGDEPYRTIVLGVADAAILDSVEDELDSRWSPLRMIESFAFAARRGTAGTLAAFGNGRNSQLVSIIGTGVSPSPSWAWAASYAGVVGYASAIDPARPFQTLALPGIIGPARGARFTRSEREALLNDGISTFTVDPAGNVAIERAITTYQLSAFALEDIAYLDVNTVLTLQFLRNAVRARILAKFPRHKLANDDARFAPGQAIVTPRIIRAELVALMRELEEAGLVEDLDQFVADLIVERDAGDPGRVNALIPPNIVNQFRVFAARVEFRL